MSCFPNKIAAGSLVATISDKLSDENMFRKASVQNSGKVSKLSITCLAIIIAHSIQLAEKSRPKRFKKVFHWVTLALLYFNNLHYLLAKRFARPRRQILENRIVRYVSPSVGEQNIFSWTPNFSSKLKELQ